jgi:hypothetical protein
MKAVLFPPFNPPNVMDAALATLIDGLNTTKPRPNHPIYVPRMSFSSFF